MGSARLACTFHGAAKPLSKLLCSESGMGGHNGPGTMSTTACTITCTIGRPAAEKVLALRARVTLLTAQRYAPLQCKRLGELSNALPRRARTPPRIALLLRTYRLERDLPQEGLAERMRNSGSRSSSRARFQAAPRRCRSPSTRVRTRPPDGIDDDNGPAAPVAGRPTDRARPAEPACHTVP
jgi:hypothetical protein